MSANQSAFAQRKTNTFVAFPTAYNGEGGISTNLYLFSEAGLALWKQENASTLTIVGNNITTSVSNYPTVIQDLWTNTDYSSYYSEQVAPGTTLTDMGKDVYIGVPGEANLLHLRLVQLPASTAALGKDGFVGYIPVEGNADIFDGNLAPIVAVARVQ